MFTLSTSLFGIICAIVLLAPAMRADEAPPLIYISVLIFNSFAWYALGKGLDNWASRKD